MTSPVAAVGSVSTNPPANATASTDQSVLDPQAFLQLLVAQLQYQDPSNPVDTSSFMQQTATLSQVQTMNSMSSTLTALVSAEQAQSATGLIGKTVSYTNSSGIQASGVVDSASLAATGATLSVGGIQVPLANVVEVTATKPTS
jgi:flagellar basal-body rod modification protein FlgD